MVLELVESTQQVYNLKLKKAVRETSSTDVLIMA